MHCRLVAMSIVVLFVAPATPAGAQTPNALADFDCARAGLRVGHGGRGLDLQASVDSPRFGSFVRFRADVGHGRWLGINGGQFEPRVTRFAASALFYFARRDVPEFPAYIGVGIGAFLPHDVCSVPSAVVALHRPLRADAPVRRRPVGASRFRSLRYAGSKVAVTGRVAGRFPGRESRNRAEPILRCLWIQTDALRAACG